MRRVTSSIFSAAALAFLMLIAACSNDPASPPDTPAGTTELDLAAILADYAAGHADAYATALHDEFRFVPPAVDEFPYARAQEIDLLAAMHGGSAGAAGEILQGIELVAIEPVDDWTETDRDDPLGAHRPGACKRVYALTLRFEGANPATVWEVSGEVTAFADTLGGQLRLLGLVDQTGDPDRSDAPSWTEIRRIWAEPEPPSLPGSPDLLSMRWIAAHDGRDWLRMGELLHPAFRYVSPEAEVSDRADELAMFADLMAGRPSRDDARVVQLDAQGWEHTEGPWSPVGADDPLFGDLPDAVAQWLDVRIVYTTVSGEEWLVDGLVRMAAVETPRGWQMLGFVDDSVDTGDPGSLGWWQVRSLYR